MFSLSYAYDLDEFGWATTTGGGFPTQFLGAHTNYVDLTLVPQEPDILTYNAYENGGSLQITLPLDNPYTSVNATVKIGDCGAWYQ